VVHRAAEAIHLVAEQVRLVADVEDLVAVDLVAVVVVAAETPRAGTDYSWRTQKFPSVISDISFDRRMPRYSD
jgi:hypothetical protein